MIINSLLLLFWCASSTAVLALQSKLEGGEYNVVTQAIIVLVSVLVGYGLRAYKDLDNE